MQKRRSHRAALIAGIAAAILFLGGVSSNLIASDLQPVLQPYRRWIWLTFALALVVTVTIAIVDARRKNYSSTSNAAERIDHSVTTMTTRIGNASAERSVAIGGDNSGPVVTGDNNVVDKFAGDKVARDKIVHIHQSPDPAASTPTGLHQVPPPPADFTGREDELKELLAAIEIGGITISGLQGMGGIGKTVLALKLVEMLKPCYPDAQFFLDLKAAGEQPLAVSEAMAHVVRAYHPAAKLPESERELRALYLSALAGQRALLLMDNAANAEQVEPLIPPAGEQQLTIVCEIGDRRGEGIALWNVSLALDQLGERAQAIQHAEQALNIFERIEDPSAARVRAQLAEWRPQTNT